MGTTTGASSRVTVNVRRIRVGENSFPSRAAFRLVSATFNVALSLSRCALNGARSALSAERSADLIRRFSLRAAYLASSFARRFIARASARRVARLLRLLNRPIPARLLVGSSTHCGLWTHTIARWWDGICGVVADLARFGRCGICDRYRCATMK